MTLAAKGLVVAGTLTAVAAAPATFFIANSKNSPSGPATLIGYRGESYKGKYANHFGKHFVTSTEDNKDWWGKSYERLSTEKTKQPTSLSSSFQTVNEAFGNNPTSSLNKVCESYHSKTYEEITTGSQNGKPSTLQDFWKFCTTVEAEIELANLTTTGKIGKKHKDILIAAEPDKNTKFWDTHEKIFLEIFVSDSSTPTDSYLLALYNSRNTGSRKTLREMCKDVYDLPENDQQKASGVEKFCSLKGKE